MNGPTTDKFQRFPIADIESYWTITNRRLHQLDLNSVLKGYKTTTCTLTSFTLTSPSNLESSQGDAVPCRTTQLMLGHGCRLSVPLPAQMPIKGGPIASNKRIDL